MNKQVVIGEKASRKHTITSNEVEEFANLSGDNNPIHLNEETARQSVFGKRICHGMLVASYISAVLGTQLPGEQSIYISQELKFLKPVFINDTIEVIVEVLEIDETKNRVRLSTNIINQDGILVLKGQALVQVS